MKQVEISLKQISITESLKIFFELIKVRITILVTLTTALGYILAAKRIGINLFYTILGIFLLACSASALNHFQERDSDYLMDRTKNRPIPSGRISAKHVILISFILFLSGFLVLLFGTNIITTAIGIFTLFWYNAIYTPLKKVSAVAIIPGALVGALPPIAGWTAAGGELFSPEIFIIAFYFFLWQIPHFWLLLMMYGEEYETAGFPVLNKKMSAVKLKFITTLLITFSAVFGIMISFSDIINYNISRGVLFITSMILIYYVLKFFKTKKNNEAISGMFFKINLYTLLLILTLSVDKLLVIL